MASDLENLQHVGTTQRGRGKTTEQKVSVGDSLRLTELRESRRLTQRGMARHLAVSQGRVSQIEHERDLHLSTLSSYVAALGGHLRIQAEFPDGSVFDLAEPREGLEVLMRRNEHVGERE